MDADSDLALLRRELPEDFTITTEKDGWFTTIRVVYGSDVVVKITYCAVENTFKLFGDKKFNTDDIDEVIGYIKSGIHYRYYELLQRVNKMEAAMRV